MEIHSNPPKLYYGFNYAVEKKHRTRHMFGSICSAVVQARMCWYDLVQDFIGTVAAARRSAQSFTSHRYGSPMMSRSELENSGKLLE